MSHIWIPGDPDPLVDDYSDAQHERRPHGVIFLDGKEVAHTLQCPHCAAHFVSRKGSGIRRSFCLRCHAVTCGASACMTGCTPFVAELERNQGREA
jgi:hypothetical protein